MATDKTTQPKAPKTPKEPVALSKRVSDQLTRAVLTKKITKDELDTLATHITKLASFV